MAFIDMLRETQKYTQDDTKRRSNIIEEWDKMSEQFTDAYNSYLKNTGRKEISGVAARQKLRDFIGKAGVEDGKWSSDDYSNSDYDEYDFQEYGTKTIKNLFGENGTMDFGTYVEKYGNADQKKTYERLNRKQGTGEKVARGAGASLLPGVATALGPLGLIGGAIGFGVAAGADAGSKKSLSELEQKYIEEHNGALNNAFDAFENADRYLANRDKIGTNAGASNSSQGTTVSNNSQGTTASTSSGTSKNEDADTVTFTLPRANDPSYRGFGQKIVDLGLATDKGLWGADGDVQFYTKQLYEQGAVDKNGNLKIGVPIKLRRRK